MVSSPWTRDVLRAVGTGKEYEVHTLSLCGGLHYESLTYCAGESDAVGITAVCFRLSISCN